LDAFKKILQRLDFAELRAQKQWRVFPLAENFYTDWRLRCGAANVLRDENDLPPERLLQAVWRHQRLQRDRLQTADGKSVRVLHPGFVSVEGGPDFRGAVIQIGGDAPRSGDVEVDLRAGGWHAHGHDRNPNFQNVILRVVWNDAGIHASADRDGRGSNRLKPELQPSPPILPIGDRLDAPIAELGLWLENESPRVLPENLRGQCCVALRELDESRQGRILDAAAGARFQARAGQFRARARHAGWEQALWEGLFRALGYKHNVWPMQNLAESRLNWSRDAGSALVLQARLLGISGLLPAELTRLRPVCRGSGAAGARAQTGGDDYVRKLWDCWWRERDEFSDCIVPHAAWKFHALRPANHPQRRLALAAHWLASGNLVSKLERWCASSIGEGRRAGDPEISGTAARRPSRALVDSLREILEVERDEFWSWHWTFRSARLKKPQPLLGDARVTDLAVNVILPWLWTRAAEGKNKKLQRVVEHRHAVWPQAEDNSILKLARQRLLGVGRSRALRSASAQQGLIQITRDFCERSNAVCDNCRFPELVRTWSAGQVRSATNFDGLD
jgi:Protein of unknown function (DUF2851)